MVPALFLLGLAGALQIYRELYAEDRDEKSFHRVKMWRKARRIRRYRQWLRQSHVIMPKPDASCRRNSVEAVP